MYSHNSNQENTGSRNLLSAVLNGRLPESVDLPEKPVNQVSSKYFFMSMELGSRLLEQSNSPGRKEK